MVWYIRDAVAWYIGCGWTKTDRQTDIQTQTDRQADRQTDRTDRQDRQTGQTGRQTDKSALRLDFTY